MPCIKGPLARATGAGSFIGFLLGVASVVVLDWWLRSGWPE